MVATGKVRDMRDAETTLTIIGDRGSKDLKLEDVYRRFYNPDLYLKGYGRLYRNEGALTRGTTAETVDGMSIKKIGEIIELLRNERFKWTPVRRMLIPKANGKTRPLGIPTWTDKLLQEVMRSILEAYYEPQFSPNSHGFRPDKGCHTALKDIFIAWKGTKWFVEGDIKGCFDNIDHSILLSILREKIQDNRFIRLVENLLKAGYLEQWNYHPTLSGTPQGGIISPLLANIYMDRLDRYVEQTLVPEYNKGKVRKSNPVYGHLAYELKKLKAKGATDDDLRPIRQQMRATGQGDQYDPDYRRLRYIRYADDFLLGFAGPRTEAEEIKEKIGNFLRDSLKLELSPEKTLITHAGTEKARFLGYDIGVNNPPHQRGKVCLRLPPEKLESKIARYMKDGKAINRTELQTDDDFTIVALYGSEFRGIVQYYSYAENLNWFNHLQWVMGTSLLKTLAAKHKSSVAKMARKYKSENYHRGKTFKCFKVIRERPDKEPLIAIFGGLRLKPDPFLMIEDLPIDRDQHHQRNELIARLLADECELCGSKENVQVHHIRKLADLKVPGRREKPEWQQVMAARRRKTLVVCRDCHWAIHNGQPTRIRPQQSAKIDV
jgi:group II intron reverse transcriptase/maturase